MHPILLKIGPVSLFSYGLMLAVAALTCAWLLSRDARKHGIPSETIYDLMFWLVLSGIAGARILYVVLHWEQFSGRPLEILMVQSGGLSFQGGFLAAAAAGAWYVRRQKLPILFMLDLMAPYIALGHAIGRIGCFLNGCCYGRPASWGIYFPVHGARLQPTQLYDTAELFLVFLILRFSQKRSQVRGEVFALYMALAGLQRFINEFFRGDHEHLMVEAVGLSVYQVFSLAIFAAGLAAWLVLRKSRPQKKA
ncbi:MAG: prolipoprotein diacylglyceryl transferase [Candidatus Omnitrophota bacterium]|nr:prolipoprotein diacylglyceryl transferase [Candidatus Omnitrophota bacterium]MDZ4241610.1 prolipoprotein diacylglyceryl transferase [Candidatus Omnitrophota bacterium]